MSEADIKAELTDLIKAESDVQVLNTIKSILINHNSSNAILEKKLISRALKAQQDLEKGRVYSRKKMDELLTKTGH